MNQYELLPVAQKAFSTSHYLKGDYSLGKLCKTPTFAPRTRTHCVNIEPMKQTTLNLDLSLKRTRKREFL
ncbi:MAG: hypothetical protein ACYCY1_15965, partial [Sulfuriferula sp.]